MSMMWQYLDKRSATIAAIMDYNNMKFIIRDTGDEIRGVYEGVTGVISKGRLHSKKVALKLRIRRNR